MFMHEITLDGYAAQCAEQPIRLGTAGSYGVETLSVMRKGEWVDYDIIVAFHPPKGESVQIRLGSDNAVSVPAEATAVAGTGEITFAGYTDGVRQISVSQIYRVAVSAGTEGIAPAEPTPDVVQQILSAARNAEEIAQSVRADAEKIKERLDEIPKIDDTAITTTSPWSSKQIVDTLCPPIEETGNPVVCYPVEGYPLDVTVSWGPTQEGSGEPSPDNVRPIKGRDGVTITRQEDNQVITLTLPETVYGGEVDAVSGEGQETWKTINLPKTGWLKDNSATFTRFNNYTALEAPANSKEQFKNILCNILPSKNTADDDTAIQLESANARMLRISVSGIKTLDDFLSFLDAYSVQVCYRLAEPLPFTATGARPIPALAGANTVLTDADSVSVSGRADLIYIIKTQEK